jgi:hypothetical protein
MINETNYFEINNGGLSQSRIKDYLICPNYFYRKNISGELKKEFKKAFQIGDAVDGLLTRSTEIDNYAVCEEKRTTKAGKAEAAELEFAGKTVISRTDYDTIVEIADAVAKTDAYKQVLQTYTFQEILEVPMELGEHFNCLYGKPDAYKINEDGVCDLLDLKSTITVDERKYFYKFFSFGYNKQLWFYSYLLKSKYPQIKSFRYWHLAVEKTEPYNVKLFSIPVGNVLACEQEMMETINAISQDTTFAKYNPSFSNPTILGSFNNEDSLSRGDWSDGTNNDEF